MGLAFVLSQGQVETESNKAGMQPLPLLLLHILILMGRL